MVSSTGELLSLLKNCAPFRQLPDKELTLLASYFQEAAYLPEQAIVVEDTLVDSVYLIAEGAAEVSFQGEILAVLRKGEAIGLSGRGLFSETGLRTATVKAVAAMRLFKLGIEDLNAFFKSHQQFFPELNILSEQIERQNFIKKIEPFGHVPAKIVEEIYEKIEVLHVENGHVFFKQGDVADRCYLIYSGTAKVILEKPDGSEIELSELRSGDLFGESGLLTKSPRNATVTATDQAIVFAINEPDFYRLIRYIPHSSKEVFSLVMRRFRPTRVEGITIHERKDAENNAIIILKNPKEGTYFQTSQEGLFVWNLLNGENSIFNISMAFYYEYKKIAIDTIENLITRLIDAGFVKGPVLASEIGLPKKSFWQRAVSSLSQLLQIQYSIRNVDNWLSSLYDRVGYLFFTRTAKILLPIISLSGFCVFALLASPSIEALRLSSHPWGIIFLTYIPNIFIVPAHELAHALTTKAYGREVHRMGVGWFWISPIAFTDTSDMWLAPKKARIAVNLAGIYINIVLSGLLAFFAWGFLSYPAILAVLWLSALFSYLMGFYNLDPVLELDGYYVLMDLFEKPNLRGYAVKWLLEARTFSKKHIPEITYWISCILFIISTSLLAYFLQNHIFVHLLPEKTAHVFRTQLTWAFAVLAFALSFLNVYAKVKHSRR